VTWSYNDPRQLQKLSTHAGDFFNSLSMTDPIELTDLDEVAGAAVAAGGAIHLSGIR